MFGRADIPGPIFEGCHVGGGRGLGQTSFWWGSVVRYSGWFPALHRDLGNILNITCSMLINIIMMYDHVCLECLQERHQTMYKQARVHLAADNKHLSWTQNCHMLADMLPCRNAQCQGCQWRLATSWPRYHLATDLDYLVVQTSIPMKRIFYWPKN